MPLIEIQSIDKDAIWALWEIRENSDDLNQLSLCDKEQEELSLIHNEKKRIEWLAARSALQCIFSACQIEKKSVMKDGYGKPFLVGAPHHISLAHSFPYAAALFNTHHSAGIDLEKIQGKILKISGKFLNQQEKQFAGENLTLLTVIWCAKEALYKLYGKKRLIFKENLYIAPFHLDMEGAFTGIIRIDDEEFVIPLYYRIMDGYVLCYTT